MLEERLNLTEWSGWIRALQPADRVPCKISSALQPMCVHHADGDMGKILLSGRLCCSPNMRLRRSGKCLFRFIYPRSWFGLRSVGCQDSRKVPLYV